MKYISTLISVIVFVLLIAFLLQKNIPQIKTVAPTVTITTQPTQVVMGAIHSVLPGKCQSDGILPDKNCTPGVIDPSVTQENIYQTICVKGYTKTVRPPVEYTNNLKREQIIEYGFEDTNLQNYEEDHLISLELGGSPSDPKNLWPQPGSSPNPKDKIENLCHKKICTGQITLADAQREIATNWQTACQ